jgi:hypothetical protein
MRAVILLGMCLWMSAVAMAAPGERVALVIGNAAYQNGRLSNPVKPHPITHIFSKSGRRLAKLLI